MNRPEVRSFFDTHTSTFSHVAWDPAMRKAAIIDAVLDYDEAAGRIGHASIETIAACVRENELEVEWIIDTHAHADHLSAAWMLRERLGGRIGIGERIREVQQHFGRVFGFEDFRADGSEFDHLFRPDEAYRLGGIAARAIATPGHTPACMTHLIGDAAFVGDTLFMPDYGSARCDFPGGDARTLFRSIQSLYTLPDATRVFLCHDYPPAGRSGTASETTVGAEKRENIHVRAGVAEDEFVAMRSARDATLSMPKLLLPSLQVNLRAGELPAAAANGLRYLRIPLDAI
ncbi:MAG: MBL fold metallo-hydrolase [Rudaea sp.]